MSIEKPQPGHNSAPTSDSEGAIDMLEAALHSLGRALRQSQLHEFLIAQAGVNVDPAGIALLNVLNSHGNGARLRMTELSAELHIDAPAVTRKAQQLERLGLVTRGPDLDDGRVTRIQLTARGRRSIARLLTARRAWLVGLLTDWSPEDQSNFARYVSRFTEDIYRDLESANV